MTAPPTRQEHRTRLSTALERTAAWAVRVRAQMPRPLRWITARPGRMVTLAWLIALMLAGHAYASADTFITGPDLAGGGPKTLFETYDFTTYSFTVKPDNNASGFLDLGTAFYGILGILNDILIWVSLGLLYGGLVLLEWFLDLTLYRDSASQIDAATQLVADHIFWPLIAATTAIGAFIAYARWRGEGRGFASDVGWVVAATVLAIGFAAGPSTIMTNVDALRSDMATGVIAGTSDFVHTDAIANPTGFPEPVLAGDQQTTAVRELVKNVWNIYAAYFWCHGEFGAGQDGITICQQVGYHALANDSVWQGYMSTLDAQGMPPVFGAEGDWIRGQDPRRLGIVLMLAAITIPTALLFLKLVFAGLKAVVGLLLMLVIGLLFLTFWPIPGWFRSVGTRYWVYVLGMEGQALCLTFVVAGQMVVVAIIGTQTGKYGYFVVAVLVFILTLAAAQAQAWLEALTSGGGGRAMGLGTVMAVRYLAGAVAGMASGGTGMVAAGARALIPARRGGGESAEAARNWAGLRGRDFWADRRKRRTTTWPKRSWMPGGLTALPPGAGPRPALRTSAGSRPELAGPPRRALLSAEGNRARAHQQQQAATRAVHDAERAARRERETAQLHTDVRDGNRAALAERGRAKTIWEGSSYRQTTARRSDVNSNRVWIGSYNRRVIIDRNGRRWEIAHESAMTELPRGREPRPYRQPDGPGGDPDDQ